jgi:hypothetical protein
MMTARSISPMQPTRCPKNAINGAATIGIVRQGSVSGTSTVLFSTTASGTATRGWIFIPPTPVCHLQSGRVECPGDRPHHQQRIAEGNQTVGLQLSGASGSALYSPSNAVLTIIDTVKFARAVESFRDELCGHRGRRRGLHQRLHHGVAHLRLPGRGFGQLHHAGRHGLAGAKYIATNGVVSFGDGETVPRPSPFKSSTPPRRKGPEYLYVLLTNATDGATLAAPTNATLTI